MPARFVCGGNNESEGASNGGSAWCWIVTGDWCAYVSVLLVWLCTVYVDACVTYYVHVPMYFTPQPTTEGWIHVAAFQYVIGVIFACHFAAAFGDPGLVARDTTNGLHERAYVSLLAQIQGVLFRARRVLKLARRRHTTKRREHSQTLVLQGVQDSQTSWGAPLQHV